MPAHAVYSNHSQRRAGPLVASVAFARLCWASRCARGLCPCVLRQGGCLRGVCPCALGQGGCAQAALPHASLSCLVSHAVHV